MQIARKEIDTLYGLNTITGDAERLQKINDLLVGDAYIVRDADRALPPEASGS